MKSEYVRFRKTIGTSALFEKSYKNTRTKNWAIPYGMAQFYYLRWDSKVCQGNSRSQQTVGQ